jgi:hypothetical protein
LIWLAEVEKENRKSGFAVSLSPVKLIANAFISTHRKALVFWIVAHENH